MIVSGGMWGKVVRKSNKVVECFGEGVLSLGFLIDKRKRSRERVRTAVCGWKRKVPYLRNGEAGDNRVHGPIRALD